MNRVLKPLVVAVASLSLAACANGGKHPVGAPAGATGSVGSIDTAFDLLMQGREHEARNKLKEILRRNPQDAKALVLQQSIDGDPASLLGQQSFHYVAVTGDTFPGLAERFLGNRLLGYRLLRYNHLSAPVTLLAGQDLLIPGKQVESSPIPRSEPRSARSPVEGVARPAAPRSRSTAARSTGPECDMGESRRARASGLAALDQGDVDRAITLLSQAAARYPCNPQIGRDLSRAQRIAMTLKARK